MPKETLLTAILWCDALYKIRRGYALSNLISRHIILIMHGRHAQIVINTRIN